MYRSILYFLIIFLYIACSEKEDLILTNPPDEIIIDNEDSIKIIDHHDTDLFAIPDNWIDSAKANLNIRYGHSSHGSQITSGGMTAIMNYSQDFQQKYSYTDFTQESSLTLVESQDELSHYDNWDIIGREYLDQHPECNVMMWAWCSIVGHDIDEYISKMEGLIADYGPGGTKNRVNPVHFVFMTAHSYAYTGNQETYEANQKIRKYCIENGRFLFDFNDIECFDPDGQYFGDGNPDGSYSGQRRLNDDMSYDITYRGKRGNWGLEWMERNPDALLTQLAADQVCESCAHSMGNDNDANSRIHCVLKGTASWSLWAVLAGWDGNSNK